MMAGFSCEAIFVHVSRLRQDAPCARFAYKHSGLNFFTPRASMT